jgi:hypothetical protein
MDPVEGRVLAMQVMLPDWDSFGEEETSGKRKGNDLLETISQVVYCMKNAKRETGGYEYDHKLDGFSLEQVQAKLAKTIFKTKKTTYSHPFRVF